MGKPSAAGKSKEKKVTTAPPAPHAGKPSALLDTRVIYCGDCLEQLKNLPETCVDLIYIDYMRPRCVELARVLKKTRSFYYHCDWHARHEIGRHPDPTN